MEEEYKLGNTIQEFEELFGNVPFEDIEKIKKWLFNNYIPISVIQNKIDELTKYRDLAKELIEERIVIADSDSLNYGRAEAHDKDIQVLKEILEKGNK